MSVKERLKQFINLKEASILAFEKNIDASNGYVSSISKSIGIDKLELISEKYPNLNIVWLLLGKGEMLKNKEYDTNSEPSFTNENSEEIYGNKTIDEIIERKINSMLKPLKEDIKFNAETIELISLLLQQATAIEDLNEIDIKKSS